MESRIIALNLDSYYLGGISFSFAVICQAHLGDNCQAILAIEPFTGAASHLPSRRQRLVKHLLTHQATRNLLHTLYTSNFAALALHFFLHLDLQVVKLILAHIDPHTFLTTAKIIMFDVPQVTFQDKPHLLFMNPNDRTLNYTTTVELFRSHVKKLAILDTELDHFPPDLSYAYFAKHLPSHHVHLALQKLRDL